MAASSVRAREREAGGADGLEPLERLVEGFASVATAPFPPEPFAVEELRPRHLGDHGAARELLEGGAEVVLRLGVVGGDGTSAQQDASCPRGVRCRHPLGQLRRRMSGERGLAAAHGGLGEIGERGDPGAVVVADALRGPERGFVVAGAELEDGQCGVGVIDGDPLPTLVAVLHHALGAGARRFVVPAP